MKMIHRAQLSFVSRPRSTVQNVIRTIITKTKLIIVRLTQIKIVFRFLFLQLNRRERKFHQSRLSPTLSTWSGLFLDNHCTSRLLYLSSLWTFPSGGWRQSLPIWLRTNIWRELIIEPYNNKTLRLSRFLVCLQQQQCPHCCLSNGWIRFPPWFQCLLRKSPSELPNLPFCPYK